MLMEQMQEKLLIKKNHFWVLASIQHSAKQIIPVRTGFNFILDKIEYLPIINVLKT